MQTTTVTSTESAEDQISLDKSIDDENCPDSGTQLQVSKIEKEKNLASRRPTLSVSLGEMLAKKKEKK